MTGRKITQPEHTFAASIIEKSFYGTPTPPAADDGGWMKIYAAFENGQMAAAMEAPVEPVTWGRQTLPAAMVAGVGSLPEHRRKGAVRAMFSALFEDLVAQQVPLALLYPFNFAFYRQFGFEWSVTHWRVQMEMAALAHIPHRHCNEAAHDHPGVRACYARFAQKHSLAFHRTESRWQRRGGAGSRYYINEGGYVLLHFGRHQNGILTVREMVYDGHAALMGLLGFLRLFAADFTHILFEKMVDGDDFSALFDPYALTVTRETKPMARLLDIPAAMTARVYPDGRFHCTLGVTDDFLPRNTGLYQLTVADGQAAVDFCPANPAGFENQANFSIDAALLAPLLAGNGLRQPRFADPARMILHRPSEKLFELFNRQPIAMFDEF